jgi:hypothetical protein
VKYANHLVLLAKGKTVLQGMIDRLLGTGRYYGMEMNVEKTRVMSISRQTSSIQIRIDEKQQDNVEYFSCFGSMITNDANCKREIKSRIAKAKAAFDKKNDIFTSKEDLRISKKLVNCYIWSIFVTGAETWTFLKIVHKCLKSFEI